MRVSGLLFASMFIAAAGMVTFENAYIFCESVKRTA